MINIYRKITKNDLIGNKKIMIPIPKSLRSCILTREIISREGAMLELLFYET